MAIPPLYPQAAPALRRALLTRTRHAVTLVEILLALSITAIIAAAVSSMLFTMSSGTQRGADQRRRNVTVDVTAHRIDSAIRSTAMLLAHGDDYIVLWRGDDRQSHKPNLSEIRRIEWDPDTNVIRSYAAYSNLAPGDDAAFELDSDFNAVTAALRDTPEFPHEVWARNVVACELGPASAGQAARAIYYSMTIEDDDGTYSFRSTVSLRGQ